MHCTMSKNAIYYVDVYQFQASANKYLIWYLNTIPKYASIKAQCEVEVEVGQQLFSKLHHCLLHNIILIVSSALNHQSITDYHERCRSTFPYWSTIPSNLIVWSALNDTKARITMKVGQPGPTHQITDQSFTMWLLFHQIWSRHINTSTQNCSSNL